MVKVHFKACKQTADGKETFQKQTTGMRRRLPESPVRLKPKGNAWTDEAGNEIETGIILHIKTLFSIRSPWLQPWVLHNNKNNDGRIQL